jgi:hypothetical protein
MATIKGFVKLTADSKRFAIVSPVILHHQHFLEGRRHSCKCLAPDRCPGCELGLPVQTSAIVAVQAEGEVEVQLLRFPRMKSMLLDSWIKLGSSLIGKLVDVERDPRPGQTQPIVLDAGRVPPNPQPVINYINAIGRRAAVEELEAIDSQDQRTR